MISNNTLRNILPPVLLLSVLIFFLTAGCKNRKSQNGKEVTSSEEQPPAPNTNIYDAALNGDIQMIKSFIKKGFDVNTRDAEGRTMLMFAAFNGHAEVIKLLLKSGAEINAKDKLNRSAITYAATSPFAEAVKLLLDHHADPNNIDNNEHWTPLMNAAAEGQMEVVKILLERGADATLVDVDGDSAESFAKKKGHNEVASYLHTWVINHK